MTGLRLPPDLQTRSLQEQLKFWAEAVSGLRGPAGRALAAAITEAAGEISYWSTTRMTALDGVGREHDRRTPA